MKKTFLYVLILSLLTVYLLPKLLISLQSEKSDYAVVNAVKISDANENIKSLLLNKQFKNIKILVFDDTFLMDKNNGSFLEKLIQNGYETALAADLSAKNDDYFRNLSDAFDKSLLPVVFIDDKGSGVNIETFEKLLRLIKDKNVVIGLLENKEQNGLRYPELENFSEEIKGSANRALFTKRVDIESLNNTEISFRLLRAVTDRGIRLNLLEAEKPEDLIQYDDVLGLLNSELFGKGYSVSSKAYPVRTYEKSIKDLLIISALAAIAVACLTEILEIKRKSALSFIFAFLTADFTVYFKDYSLAMILLTLIITVSVPTAVTLLLYKYITSKSCKVPYVNILLLHAAAFAVYIISGMYIWFTLSDYVFRIGFVTYKFAIISYIVPLLIILIYILKHEGYNYEAIKKALCNKKSIAIMLLSALITAVYLSRSGNFSLFPASSAELYFRMLLEKLMPVRPRLKEFLLGYPSLFLLLSINNRTNKQVSNYLLIFSAITGISVLNTFCHGFTAVNVSFIRALLGFVFGTFTGTAAYFLIKTYSSDRTW